MHFYSMTLTQRLSVVALVCCAAALCALPAAVKGQGTLEVDCCGAHEQAARVVLLSDSHVMAPQQDLQHLGSNEVDVLTVLKSQARLWQVVAQKINSLVPAPKLAVFGGDLVHRGLGPSQDLGALLHGPLNGFHIAKGLLDQLAMPLALGLGNHDYKVMCGDPEASAPKHVTRHLFRHYFGADPYTAVHIGGWKLLVLNSQLGHTWQADHPGCNPKLASYGRRQLRWAARQLSAGRPTVVLLHFPLPLTAVNEAPDLRWPDVVSLLSAHSNVKLVLSFHLHRGIDWGDLYPFPHFTLPATRFHADNFMVLDLQCNGSYSIPDWGKNKGGSRCSQTWTYHPNGTAEPADQQGEPGDCGLPLAQDSDAYHLPAITRPQDIPVDFSPELTCSWALAKQVFAPCLREGASSPCCSILATQVTLAPHYSFAGCLCHPDFWQDAEATFASAQQNLSSVIEGCIDSTHAVILHRGWGACPPPAAAAEAS